MNNLEAINIYEKDIKIAPSFNLFDELIESHKAEDMLTWLGTWGRENPKQQLSVYINSYGGEVAACIAVVEAFKVSPNPIRTVVTGIAYSGAALLAAAGDRGERYAYKSADFLIHQIQTSDGNGVESLPDREKEILDDKHVNEILMRLFAEFTGQPLEKIRRDTKKDKYMTAKRALRYGLIDHIVERTKK